MVAKDNFRLLVANCSGSACTICRSSDWRRSTKKFIGQGARCHCNCRLIPARCICFSGSAMKRIVSRMRITNCCSRNESMKAFWTIAPESVRTEKACCCESSVRSIGYAKQPQRKSPRPRESDRNWPTNCIGSCRRISSPEIRQMLLRSSLILSLATAVYAQTPTPVPTASPEEETVIPTFETQKLARPYVLDVPAPRGQITDRTGLPLAQNTIAYNLAINFPTPLDFSDAQALGFVREQIDKAEKLIGRPIKIPDETILRHYRNRGILPFEIAQNLTQSDYGKVNEHLPAAMVVR